MYNSMFNLKEAAAVYFLMDYTSFEIHTFFVFAGTLNMHETNGERIKQKSGAPRCARAKCGREKSQKWFQFLMLWNRSVAHCFSGKKNDNFHEQYNYSTFIEFMQT